MKIEGHVPISDKITNYYYDEIVKLSNNLIIGLLNSGGNN